MNTSPRRVVVLVLLTLLWCGVAYMEAVIWTDYVSYRGQLRLRTAVMFGVAQILYGLFGTLATVPFWLLSSRDEPTEHS